MQRVEYAHPIEGHADTHAIPLAVNDEFAHVPPFAGNDLTLVDPFMVGYDDGRGWHAFGVLVPAYPPGE